MPHLRDDSREISAKSKAITTTLMKEGLSHNDQANTINFEAAQRQRRQARQCKGKNWVSNKIFWTEHDHCGLGFGELVSAEWHSTWQWTWRGMHKLSQLGPENGPINWIEAMSGAEELTREGDLKGEIEGKCSKNKAEREGKRSRWGGLHWGASHLGIVSF